LWYPVQIYSYDNYSDKPGIKARMPAQERDFFLVFKTLWPTFGTTQPLFNDCRGVFHWGAKWERV